jgi:hypothetical protein
MHSGDLPALHADMLAIQIKGLEFYVEKYTRLAGLTRTMQHEKLATILDKVAADAQEALDATRALIAGGDN